MSILYIVATPIGHLNDLSSRARSTLADVDVIAAEDTRRTGQLLQHLGLSATLLPLHDHNERGSTEKVLALLQSGQCVALVSDAGTPLISDPGFDLVRQCHAQGIVVSPVPGASSVTAALSAAGLPTNRFSFEGFVPARSKARRDFYRSLRDEQRTMVMFEVPHRIGESMGDLADELGDTRVLTLCRELTKTYEQIVSGTSASLCQNIETGDIPAKGEFVLVVSGVERSSGLDVDPLLKALLVELPPGKAAAVAASLTEHKKSVLYERAMAMKDELVSR